MHRTNLRQGLVALISLGVSASLGAQEIDCSNIRFSPEAFTAYEFIDKACLEIVDLDGASYARLTSYIVAQTSNETIWYYQHADGNPGPEHMANNPGFLARIEGKDVIIRDLPVLQGINIYVPESFWTVVPEE